LLLFFRNVGNPGSRFMGEVRLGFGVKDREGPDMAPQAVEIARNGHANGARRFG
jgi:hypothetical protein